jgi:Pentapeptide repeats (8 copies)
MANDEHVALLKQGVDAWNAWRVQNPNIRPDLMGAALTEANLAGADLHRADLSEANLCGANLHKTDLGEADLVDAYLNEANLNGADLFGANLVGSDLVGADLVGANLSGANLTGANLGEANLRGADLRLTHLVQTDLTDADLTGCRIYGLSAWGLKLERAKQQDLVITRADEPEITVDNIEVAQFVYLLLHNEKIREVIDTITSKAVLILGRFIQERKPVLEALREELRQRKYLPILFDFEKPRSRNTDETITLLARMARFVVADISDAKSVLQELRAIVPDLPSVPVQPIILAMQEEPGMFDFYRNFRSFLNIHRYASQEQLIADLGEKVIRPAELKVLDLQGST